MATINTTDDLIRLLHEDQEFRTAARRELLTEELLALPALHAALATEVRDFVKAANQRFDAIENSLIQLNQKTDGLEQKTDSLEQKTDRLEQKTDRLEQKTDRLEQKTDRLDANVRRLSHDFRNFRGNFAVNAAERDSTDIAIVLSEAKGLDIDETSVNVLSREQIRAMARAYGSENLAAIPKGDRRSFYLSDLIMEVSKEDGKSFYIAVEVSYTCNVTDTHRATTHADLLTKFTGRQAWAAVTGVRIDRRIQSMIDEGTVLWYPVEEEELEPDDYI